MSTIDWAAQYQQTLGRAPDAGGLAYWQSKAGDSGSILDYFQREAQKEIAGRAPAPAPTYSPPTPAPTYSPPAPAPAPYNKSISNGDGYLARTEIDAAYQQLFGRQGETAGLDYWYNKGKEGGANEQNLVALMSTAALGDDRTAASYQRDNNFTSSLGKTWDNPTGLLAEANKAPIESQLKWNATDSKWEIPGAAAPAPKPTPAPIGTPSSSSNFSPNFARQVTDDELVESRVANLVKNGHPLLEQARQRTLEQFASRGLLNSSMAAQAAQEAVLAKAMEMASQDASTFNRQGMANQAFENEFSGREQIQNYSRENAHQDYLYRGDLMERELNLRNEFQSDTEVRNELQTSRTRYQDTLSQYQRDYQNQYQRLVEMEGVDAGTKNRMLDDLNARYQATYASTNAIYSKVPDWKNEWLSYFG